MKTSKANIIINILIILVILLLMGLIVAFWSYPYFALPLVPFLIILIFARKLKLKAKEASLRLFQALSLVYLVLSAFVFSMSWVELANPAATSSESIEGALAKDIVAGLLKTFMTLSVVCLLSMVSFIIAAQFAIKFGREEEEG